MQVIKGQNCYTIGEVAKRTGVSPQTIKRWESERKIPAAHRLARNRWRFFTEEQVKEIEKFRDSTESPMLVSQYS
jgi:excisionase family DNA binding protein